MLFNGFIVVNKPVGLTSTDVVRRVKRLISRQKVGHGGTLDPIADGVLPIGLGQATRLMEYILDGTKEYLATFRLGEKTDTYDYTGKIIGQSDFSFVTRESILKSIPKFTGWIYQKPPRFSALKFKGKRAYNLARAGVEFELTPRLVKVHSISLERLQLPDVEFRIRCSRGFYVRSLANDLGEYVGCGSHVVKLTRLKVGPFNLPNSITLDELEIHSSRDSIMQIIEPMDVALKGLRKVSLNPDYEASFIMGKPLIFLNDLLKLENDEYVRVYNNDCNFFSIAKYDAIKNQLLPVKVFKS